MLADNLESWAKCEREEGEKRVETRGRMTTLKSTLRKQTTLKFGDIPAWADQRLMDASENNELDTWAEKVMTAESLEAVFTD